MSRREVADRRDYAKAQREFILRNYGIEPVTSPDPAILEIVPYLGADLTARELEIMELYLDLGGQKNIGPLLGISFQTVKNHISAAYRKVGATTAIDFYRIMGWLKVPDNVPAGQEPVPLTEAASWSIRLK